MPKYENWEQLFLVSLENKSEILGVPGHVQVPGKTCLVCISYFPEKGSFEIKYKTGFIR